MRTPEERAAVVISRAPPLLVEGDDWEKFQERIARAIREAVAEEREACAALADVRGRHELAKAIRTRRIP